MLIFLLFVILVSTKVNKSLEAKNTNVAKEYNKLGDATLFNYATKTGTLKLFDLRKLILVWIIVPFSCLFLIFGILALHLAVFKQLKQFFPPGMIAVVVSLGVTFLFIFEDKRILDEARRRNQFLFMAEKRWKISKIVYIGMILIAMVSSTILIENNMNFLEKGKLTSNGQTTYSGNR